MNEQIEKKPKGHLAEVARLFLKLGCISFGGPAAHIAMMENEVVKKKKWMDHDHFLDLVSATNLIPGPNAAEMSMHCGRERAGAAGLIAAGFCFIFPATVITACFAWLYLKYGQLPQIEPFIYGIKPAVIAIIIGAVYNLGKRAIKNLQLLLLGLMTLAASLLGVNEILVLFVAGILGIALHLVRQKYNHLNSFMPFTLLTVGSAVFGETSLLKIFLIFLKVGAVLYGSGYVLFAFLDAELVANGLLGSEQLIDAIAVGQFTPGPVLSSATFVGWQLHGLTGALVATIGVFLPSFVFVWLLNPLVPKMRKSKPLSAFLDTVNVASVALILTVAVQMSREAVTDWRTILIALSSFAIAFGFRKVNNAAIVLGAAVLGYLFRLI